jgi:flagellar basal-body rod protein FlgC
LAQQVRLDTTASNLANADTAGTTAESAYRAREPVFATLLDRYQRGGGGSGVRVVDVVERDRPLRREYQPAHPLANEEGYVYMPNIDPVEEMANMISAARSFETNVEVLKTTKQLLLRTLSLAE